MSFDCMEHILPIDDPAGIGVEVLDVDKGLIVIYGPDDKAVRKIKDEFFAELRTSLEDYGSSTFLNFDKDTTLPDTNNISFFYKLGLLGEMAEPARYNAMLGVFANSVTSQNPHTENDSPWDHVVPNAPDDFFITAARSASLGGKVIISCIAESIQEVMDKFTGISKRLLQTALAKLIAVSSTGEITVTDTDLEFWNNTLFPRKRAEPFPTFAELGGSDTLAKELVSTHGGLALFSGRLSSGKTTAIAALANELQRAGRDVRAVRAQHVESFPGIEEYAGNVFGADFKEFLIEDKPDVVIVDDIRSREAACFVADLLEQGVLVIASIHAYEPSNALSHFLFLCGGERNEIVADTLLFSHGLKISTSSGTSNNDAVSNAVIKSEILMGAVNPGSIPSRYDANRCLSSDIIWPDESTRESILAYDAKVTAIP
jgi:hypothetical protein